MDILGKALLDFQSGDHTEDIKTTSSLNEEDCLPLPHLFRTFKEMPVLEQKAMQLCEGSILDIGCGAGSHSLHLQSQGMEVIALDSSLGAIEVCQRRGVKKVVCTNILTYSDKKFDTLLLLMNGIGLAGRIERLPSFLRHLKSLLKTDGQIITDSSNIIYMFEKEKDGGYWVPGGVDYYGEVSFQMQYKGEKGPIFDWLYLDFKTLSTYAQKEGLNCELIVEGPHYDYLARLKNYGEQ